MRRHHRAPAAVAVLLLLVACGEATPGEWGGAVQDSAGIEIVANPGDGVWTDADRWTLSEDLRIGVATGAAELQFGQIAGVDADDEGRIYVLDQQASRIRIFDPAGEFVTAFGSRGQGPGELSQFAMGLFIDPAGDLLVPDAGNQRMARYSADGEPLEGRPMNIDCGIPMLWAAGPDRTIVQQVRRMTLPGQPDTGVEPADFILALGPDAAAADTLARLPAGESFSTGSGGMPEIRIFAPETVWAVLPGGRLATGLNTEYALEIRGPGGEVERIVRRAFTREEVTQADRDGVTDAMLDAWADAGMPEEAASQMASIVQFEEEWPALATLLAGVDGSLWVQRLDPDRGIQIGSVEDLQDLVQGSPLWDVFDAEGRYLGEIEMPEDVRPVRMLDDRIYATGRDELGAPQVVRLRIERPAGA